MPQRQVTVGPIARLPFSGAQALATLVAVAAVAAHQVTYVLGLATGSGEAAADAHDAYWPPLVAVVLVAAVILAAVTWRQLRRLSDRAGHGHVAHPRRELRAYAVDVLAMWLRLGVATVLVYVLQENLERIHAGLAPLGLQALVAHGPVPLIVVGLAALAVALVVALVRWRCEALLARLASLEADGGRRASPALRPTDLIRLDGRRALRAGGSRAPPMVTQSIA